MKSKICRELTPLGNEVNIRMKELITLTELANALQVKPDTVTALVNRKEIPFEKVTNKLLKVRGTTVEAEKGRLLTVKQVAELLNVTPATVYLWTKRGILSCIRLGRTIRFDPEIMKQITGSSAKQSAQEG